MLCFTLPSRSPGRWPARASKDWGAIKASPPTAGALTQGPEQEQEREAGAAPVPPSLPPGRPQTRSASEHLLGFPPREAAGSHTPFSTVGLSQRLPGTGLWSDSSSLLQPLPAPSCPGDAKQEATNKSSRCLAPPEQEEKAPIHPHLHTRRTYHTSVAKTLANTCKPTGPWATSLLGSGQMDL